MQLNKKLKLEYFDKCDSSKGSEPFWLKAKRYFTNKHSKTEKKDNRLKKQRFTNTFN